MSEPFLNLDNDIVAAIALLAGVMLVTTGRKNFKNTFVAYLISAGALLLLMGLPLLGSRY